MFSVQYVSEEKDRSWHTVNDLCFIQYLVGLKWFSFVCSAQELLCSFRTQNNLILMQSLAAAVPEMLKAAAVTASATANLGAAGKVIDVNFTNPANFIIILTVFEGFYLTLRYAGKIAVQFPNGYKLKCCVRNDQCVGVAAAHVPLRSLCIFWAGLCCQLQGPVMDVLGCPAWQSWEHLSGAARPQEGIIISSLGDSYFFLSPQLSRGCQMFYRSQPCESFSTNVNFHMETSLPITRWSFKLR